MPGAKWMEHLGKKMLFIDFSMSRLQEVEMTIAQAKTMISMEPYESVLCLVDTTGSRFTLEISTAMKNFSAFNKPYIKMTAIVGVEGLQKVVYNGILLFTGRKNLELKQSRQEALDWLATYDIKS